LNRGSGCFDDNCPGARGSIAPSVGSYVVDRVRSYLRCVDQDISGQYTIDESPIGEIITLVVLLDCTKVGVGGANVYDRGVAALDADRGGVVVAEILHWIGAQRGRNLNPAEPQ
jgi:hypothetical protein